MKIRLSVDGFPVPNMNSANVTINVQCRRKYILQGTLCRDSGPSKTSI